MSPVTWWILPRTILIYHDKDDIVVCDFGKIFILQPKFRHLAQLSTLFCFDERLSSSHHASLVRMLSSLESLIAC